MAHEAQLAHEAQAVAQMAQMAQVAQMAHHVSWIMAPGSGRDNEEQPQ